MKMWSERAHQVEHIFERSMFASRWLLAPFFLGLAVSIVVLLIKFASELLHIVTHAFSMTETETILGVLSLVDLTLAASLLIIVIFSGYENFVSKIDHSGHKDWPEWMGTIDFTGLKLKLLSSIVAISAVQLLKQFFSIETVTKENLMWLCIVHVVFIFSMVLLALADRIAGHQDAPPGQPIDDTGTNRIDKDGAPAGDQKGEGKPKPPARKP